MPRLAADALADEARIVTADVLWMASSTGDSMSITDGSASLYTDALLRVLRDRDPATYEATQAAIQGLLSAYDQRVPAISYFGGRGRWGGRPFRP
ncbi:MAG: hypothetical protein R3B09_14635 [Nannocystaceae bacterium]